MWKCNFDFLLFCIRLWLAPKIFPTIFAHWESIKYLWHIAAFDVFAKLFIILISVAARKTHITHRLIKFLYVSVYILYIWGEVFASLELSTTCMCMCCGIIYFSIFTYSDLLCICKIDVIRMRFIYWLLFTFLISLQVSDNILILSSTLIWGARPSMLYDSYVAGQ